MKLDRLVYSGTLQEVRRTSPMSAAIWFWIIYVISLVFGGGWYWRNQQTLIAFGPFTLLFFILIGLVGWGTFGPPIR